MKGDSIGFQGVRCGPDCESALGALRIQPDSQSGGFHQYNRLASPEIQKSLKGLIPSKLRRDFWLHLNTTLEKLETAGVVDDALPESPIFIIGAPRSGSTLLYQVLVEAFDVGYLSNLHCRFYGGPWLVERWIFPRLAHPAADYTSDHGRIQGRTAPSECGEFWYRFFPRDPQAVTSIPTAKQQALRRAIYRLVSAAQRPFLFKNLMNSLRLPPLARALPEARFIVIYRHPLANARSLLQARKRAYGDYRPWWSARPANVDELAQLPPHQQVVEQIIAIYQGIDAARPVIGSHRFLDVQYERFCQDVPGSLQDISRFFAEQDVSLAPRGAEIPASFPIATGGELEPALEDALRAYLTAQQDRLPSFLTNAHE